MKSKRVWTGLAIVGVLACATGLYVYAFVYDGRTSIPPEKKFEFQFGRGSGWHGLDLLRITSDGTSEYEFQESQGEWRHKAFVIPAKQVEDLREAINRFGILDLNRHYHGGVHDGTQWCLLIKVEGESRSFYFDNNFPGPIRKLAGFVDQSVLEPFAAPVQATIVPTRNHRKHEKEIWASIR